MDTPELDMIRRQAGKDYWDALRKLGLEPDGLFWAHDGKLGFVLVLITEMFDYKGPLEISKLLFKAYNAAATPREVDPFIVRLHSPEQTIVRDSFPMGVSPSVQKVNEVTKLPEGSPTAIKNVKFGDFTMSHDWVYKFKLPDKKKTIDLGRRWSRFERNVERLAA
jgi:hypothetical protein